MSSTLNDVSPAVWRVCLAMLLCALSFAAVVVAQSATAPATAPAHHDLAGVRAAVEQRTTGRQKRDAAISAAPFADDATWMNAFGRRVTGGDAIEQFFKELYTDAGYLAGKNVEEKEPEITFLRPDVAVAHVFHRTQGQRARDGSPMSERRIHQTMVLTREPDGWRIRQEVVMDERESKMPR